MFRFYCLRVFLAAAVLAPSVGFAQDRRNDDVTRILFEQYVARQVKINTDTVMAATVLVAARGRETGFWKTVLAELKRGKADSEIGCVRVLGMMLATDAAARDAIRRHKETGEISAWIPSVHLGPEVVVELNERGGKADRFRVDHYTIALARSRAPEASNFFKTILQTKQSPPPTTADAGTAPAETAPARQYYMDGTKFHAAVGLAQLGDMEGVDWLVANCQYREGTVSNATPKGTRPGGDLCACCQEALRHLSGENSRASQAEWAEWAKSVDKKSLLWRGVVFDDP